VFDEETRRYLASARVGRLATADGEGRPHVVPVCFALVGDALVTAVDEKPKSAPPDRLRRVRDVTANPRVALVVDHYTEDWSRLGWVQVRGTAAVLDPGDAPADPDGDGSGSDGSDGPGGPGSRDGDDGDDSGAGGVGGPGPGHAAAVAALCGKYDQYADHALAERPVIRVVPGSVRTWGDLRRPGE
jgi:PPOX class probable F420-dependent enzyme